MTVQDGEDARCRGARQKLDEERRRTEEEREHRRQQHEADMDPEERAERERIRELKRKETEERQRLRAEEDRALEKMQKKLDKEDAKKAASRLEYLFRQSPIFAKLKMGKGSMNDEPENVEEEKKDSSGRTRGKPKNETGARPHHIHDKESAGEDEDEEEEEDQHVFLTKQPNCIKFGQLKPYQLESLNWMIHLAEKGLNGILADEVRCDDMGCERITSSLPLYLLTNLAQSCRWVLGKHCRVLLSWRITTNSSSCKDRI
jgi:SNF2 family DNA or RNA helicase